MSAAYVLHICGSEWSVSMSRNASPSDHDDDSSWHLSLNSSPCFTRSFDSFDMNNVCDVRRSRDATADELLLESCSCAASPSNAASESASASALAHSFSLASGTAFSSPSTIAFGFSSWNLSSPAPPSSAHPDGAAFTSFEMSVRGARLPDGCTARFLGCRTVLPLLHSSIADRFVAALVCLTLSDGAAAAEVDARGRRARLPPSPAIFDVAAKSAHAFARRRVVGGRSQPSAHDGFQPPNALPNLRSRSTTMYNDEPPPPRSGC
jgi:hypothetical protein